MKVNQSKLGVILSYITMILGYIILIAYTPIMLHLLGQSEYGLYNLVASLVGYLGLISFGFSSAYMKYYSRYKVKKEQNNISKLNGMFLIIYCLMALIAVVSGAILVMNIEVLVGYNLSITEIATAKILMSIMVLNIAISFPTSVFNSYITANEEYVFQKLLQMIKILISPFITLPILLMGYKSIGMVIGTTILTIIIEICNILFCIKKLNMEFVFKKNNIKLFKEMAIFSSYIFLNMIIEQINWSVDKFILGRTSGTAVVAVYGLATQLNAYYLTLATTISNVFIPRIHKMIVKGTEQIEIMNLLIKVGRIQFMVLSLILSGFVLFGKPFINMWVGKEYSETYFIVILLIVPATIPLIQSLGYEVQKAKNMHKFRSWIYLFIAIANVIISIPLAKKYGGIGAATGTAIAIIVGNGLIMNWYYHKKVGLDMNFFWRQIISLVPAILLSMVFGSIIIFSVNLNNPIVFIFNGCIYVIVFIISIWVLGMNSYEKMLIKKPLKVLTKKITLHKANR